MRILKLFSLLLLVGCSIPQDENPMLGDWQFLDKYGNYNETRFDDTTFQSINRFVNKKITFRYEVRNDSLYSNSIRDLQRMKPVASVQWLEDKRLVLSNEFVSDTLHRISGEKVLLSNTDPFSDSTTFYTAFYRRYEEFLVLKGILTEEEIKQFRERGDIPEDVQDQMK